LRPAWPVASPAPGDGFERVASTDALPRPWPTVPQPLKSCDAWRLRALAEEVNGGPGVQQQRDAQVRRPAVGRAARRRAAPGAPGAERALHA
jgi:hypothetical protein